MTYNIHHGRGLDGVIDLERIADIIRESKAELVALQELDKRTERSDRVDQLAKLASLTNMHPAFGKAIEFAGGEYGVGVLSKFRIVESQTHTLPSSEDHEQRVALETTIQLPDASRLTFVSTHLDHTRRPDERIPQLMQLNRLFALRPNCRIILAGDLNSARDSPELNRLLKHWRPASLNTPAPTIPANTPTRQIDYVMLRKVDAWIVENTEVLHRPVASDHAPLIAKLIAIPSSSVAKHGDLLASREGSTEHPIQTTAQWDAERGRILESMQAIMGKLPGDEKRCDLDIEISDEVDCGTYVRKLISYASEPGCRVPAYLQIPKSVEQSKLKTPAVLCLHPTDDQVGHKVVVGLGGRAGRQYAQELAERGYVTLAPAYPLLANYQPDTKALGYSSGTMKAIWDNIRAIDVLESLPYVASGGVGVIGHSLGGHNGVYTAVFDTRIKVVVTSCGLDSYQDYKNGDIRGWTGPRYMPQLRHYSHRLHQLPFDFHHLIATIAPRACFISAPIGDSNFQWQSVKGVADAARQVYELYDAADKLIVEHPDCEHDFPKDVRQRAYTSIDRALGK
jgi:endonuclease/exonuclease/phosphatase family metal-dependent hydrolase